MPCINEDFSKRMFQEQKGISQEQLDLIWVMAVGNFGTNNNEVVIPKDLAVRLNYENIEELKLRFSKHFNSMQVEASVDHLAQAIRIHVASETPFTRNSNSACSSPFSSFDTTETPSPDNKPSPSAAYGVNTSPTVPTQRLRLPGKKSAVRRPPNAFILYRKKWHSIIAEKSPGLMNNEISVILGKQWKEESEQVKAHFKALAEKMKEQHARENPGYSYAPRKTTEVKRRMTARKRAKRQANPKMDHAQIALDLEDLNMSDHADSNVNEAAAFPFPVSAACVLEIERPSFPSHIDTQSASKLSITMPTGHDLVEYDYAKAMSGSSTDELRGFDPPRNITSYTIPQVANEDDFMGSLIDWDAMSQDMEYIRKSTSQEFDQATTTEAGQAVLSFESLDEEAKFQAELDRFLWMLA